LASNAGISSKGRESDDAGIEGISAGGYAGLAPGAHRIRYGRAIIDEREIAAVIQHGTPLGGIASFPQLRLV
jgi:hypothetical protein